MKSEEKIREKPVIFSRQRGYLSNRAVNKEREASSVTGINPSAVDCDVAAEHSCLATFKVQTIIHINSFRALGRLTAVGELRRTIATRKPEADRATGFYFSSHIDDSVSAERSMTPNSLRCKYSVK